MLIGESFSGNVKLTVSVDFSRVPVDGDDL